MIRTAADPLIDLRIEVLRRYGSVTAYRIGLLVGARHLSLANPYTTPRTRASFDQGVASGRKYPGGLT